MYKLIKLIKRSFSLLLVIAVFITLLPVSEVSASKIYSDGTTFYNVNGHGGWANQELDTSFLTITDNGYMRVEVQEYNIFAEYFDKQFKFLERKLIPFESGMTKFGGFYNGKDAYYIVFAVDNNSKLRDPAIENLRVVKYDKEWNHIDSVSMYYDEYKCNIFSPFNSGKVAITESKGYLFIHTSRKALPDKNAICHQMNYTIAIKESDMTICTRSMNLDNAAYCSHALYQKILTDDNGDIVMLDQVDSYPSRGILIQKFDIDNYLDFSQDDNVKATSATLMEYYNNSVNLNIYGNEIGDMDYSINNYLTVGVSYEQNSNEIIREKNNIYLTVTPKNSNVTPIESTTKWITKYEEDNTVNNPTNPYLIKLSDNDDDFLLIWGENIITSSYNIDSNAKLCYVRVNGEGETTSEIKSLPGFMSDCKPIYEDGKITWYLQNDDKVTLCQLDYENDKLINREYYDDFYLTTPFMRCLPNGNLINWPKLSDVSGYRFVRYNDSDNTEKNINLDINASSYLDTDPDVLVSGAKYSYTLYVKFNDCPIERIYSGHCPVRRNEFSLKKIKQVYEGVMICWNKDVSSNGTVYVYRKNTPEENWGKPIDSVSNFSSPIQDTYRYYIDKTAEMGKKYYYMVRATYSAAYEGYYLTYNNNGLSITTRVLASQTPVPSNKPPTNKPSMTPTTKPTTTPTSKTTPTTKPTEPVQTQSPKATAAPIAKTSPTPSATKIPVTDVVKDGWYKLSLLGTYVNYSTDGNAILKKGTPNESFYLCFSTNNGYSIKTQNGTYLGLTSGTSGSSLKEMETPYYFNITTEGSNQYAIRTKSDYNMVVNANGEKSADNTKLIIWPDKSEKLSSNALFSLISSADSHTHSYTSVETVPASPGTDGKLITKCVSCGRVLKSESIGCPVSMLLSKTEYTYSGKANTPVVTVLSSRGVAINTNYYTVVYNNNIKAGKATAVVTFSGIYKGTMSAVFNISLKKPTLSSVKAGRKSITAKWKNTKGMSGYEIQYALKKSFTKAKKLKVKASARKVVVKKLKSKKQYYVRIRYYMKSNSETIYSSWSKAKKAKVK